MAAIMEVSLGVLLNRYHSGELRVWHRLSFLVSFYLCDNIPAPAYLLRILQLRETKKPIVTGQCFVGEKILGYNIFFLGKNKKIIILIHRCLRLLDYHGSGKANILKCFIFLDILWWSVGWVILIIILIPCSLTPDVCSVEFWISVLLILLIYQLINYINEVPIIQIVLKPTQKRCDTSCFLRSF